MNSAQLEQAFLEVLASEQPAVLRALLKQGRGVLTNALDQLELLDQEHGDTKPALNAWLTNLRDRDFDHEGHNKATNNNPDDEAGDDDWLALTASASQLLESSQSDN